VDEGVARIEAELRAQGRLKDTLFVLTSDNGMGYGAHAWWSKEETFTTQVPLFIRWDRGRGRLPAVNGTYVSSVDLAATLCDVGGCEMGPYPDGRQRSDGTSLLPIILGTGEVEREAIYSEHLAGVAWRSLRTTPDSPLGLWHYAEYESGERELYDARGPVCWKWTPSKPGDPCDLTNLANDPGHAATVEALRELLATAIETGGAAPAFRGRPR
jgi:choline-sulfatase